MGGGNAWHTGEVEFVAGYVIISLGFISSLELFSKYTILFKIMYICRLWNQSLLYSRTSLRPGVNHHLGCFAVVTIPNNSDVSKYGEITG